MNQVLLTSDPPSLPSRFQNTYKSELVRVAPRLITLAGHNWFRRKESRPIGIRRCSWPEVEASHRWRHTKTWTGRGYLTAYFNSGPNLLQRKTDTGSRLLSSPRQVTSPSIATGTKSRLVRVTHRLIALAGHNWFRRKTDVLRQAQRALVARGNV